MQQHYRQLKKRFARLSQLQYIQRILMWDEAVIMPAGAETSRIDAMGTLERTIQKILSNKKMQLLIEKAKQEKDLSSWDKMNLIWMEKKYIRANCIPLTLAEKSTKAALICEQAWRKLRPQNNWKAWLPYLEASFQCVKEIAERQSDVLQLSPYDTLLDMYAAGFNQSSIDSTFTTLKKALPELMTNIIDKQRQDLNKEFKGPFSIEKQKMLGLNIMGALQFDFQRGRLDVSHHPFCSGGPSDVRITTRYREDEFITSLLGICHETGHALYEQGLPQKWLDQPVGKIDNMAMHESQSLLVEMDVCRSHAFVQYLTPLIQKTFDHQEAFTADNLYKQMTRVKTGLIRVDADEVTYPLHIILRYEMEKDLFSGHLAIQDLPVIWNELMTQYLGVSTNGNDKNGVMQDVHWASGTYGYFPAYTLGRLMAAQYFATFIKANPHFYHEVKEGHFHSLRNWLEKNIYCYASSLSVDDLLRTVTGESLNPVHFLEHIKTRYLV